MRFTADQPKLMRNGLVPEWFVVHHIVPLFRSGTNNASNLRHMKESFPCVPRVNSTICCSRQQAYQRVSAMTLATVR